MKVLVTGGTGFIGRALVKALVDGGNRVTVLSRSGGSRSDRAPANEGLDPVSDAARDEVGGNGSRISGARLSTGSVDVVSWDPLAAGDWFEHVEGQDAIVHLAGERVVGRRLTQAVKQRATDSRVRSTELLVDAIERAIARPKVFVCASAVGYYGLMRGNTPLDERATPGDDFFAQLCVVWEHAAERAETLGVRVVRARQGIALGRGGGALSLMALPYKLFVGGPIGSGEQVLSWVHLEDTVRALTFALEDPRVSGPVNVSAPNAATNAEVSRALSDLLGRPNALRVPAFALKLAFGEGAESLLSGQRVVPHALMRYGFRFRYPELRPALQEALGRN